MERKKHTLDSFLEYEEMQRNPKKQRIEKEIPKDIPQNCQHIASEQESTINPYTFKPFSKRYYEILQKRKILPAWEAKDNIITLLKENQILIIQGETGSGKTTQIPQFLLSAGYTHGLAVTQPRRVAAMSVARRVSEEMDVQLGEHVGYSIRFEEVCSNKTLIKYLTDGMLLREAITDPLLHKYCCVIIDEAHERTLATDILFGFIKEILPKRQDLKLIVMSATLDINKFQDYFNAPVVIIPGRIFPVTIKYLNQPAENYFDTSVTIAVNIHKTEKEGDILLFLTGEEEIENACAEIRKKISEMGNKVGYANVIPLYSTLPPAQQQRIFDPAPGKNEKGIPGRKIIVATNIAETSITIDGIVFVIDPGFSKQKIYNPRVRMESLLVSIISKESADQRAGRAGRTRPGKCFRLYTEQSYENDLQKTTYPEILRSNITSVVLNLKKLGIDDLVHFDFIDPPAPETMMRALEMLNYLGALNDEGDLTPLGSQMSQLPLDPELSKMLLCGEKFNCMNEILAITSMLSSQNPFLRPKDNTEDADECKSKFHHTTGDHLTLLIAYNTYKLNDSSADWCRENFINPRSMKAADDVRNQLVNILTKMGIKIPQTNSYLTDLKPKRVNNIIKCLAQGYFGQVAHLEPQGYYMTVKDDQLVFIHPSSAIVDIKPPWVIFQEFVLTSRSYIRTVTKVDPRMLLEVADEYFDLDEMKNSNIRKDLIKIREQMRAEKNSNDEEEVEIVSKSDSKDKSV